MYIVVRSDLEPGLITAQACHVAMAAVEKWHCESLSTIAVLDCGTFTDLFCLQGRLMFELPFNAMLSFYEPDFDEPDQLTGIAIHPDHYHPALQGLPLLFSKKGGE